MRISLQLLYILLFLVSSQATATPIYFNFLDPELENVDESPSLSISKNDLTIFLITNQGVLNRTQSAFGINSSGSGDDTDEIDSGSSIEEMLGIYFNKDVTLKSFSVSKLGSSDAGKLTFGIDTLLLFSNSGTYSLDNYFLPENQKLNLAYVSGNGFSFDSLTVEVASVSEPASYMILIAGVLGLFIHKRFRLIPARRDVRFPVS